jgi:class 3 adenylate cyclase
MLDPALNLTTLNLTGTQYSIPFTATLNMMVAQDEVLLQTILSGDSIKARIRQSWIELGCFELACILATVVVIVMQRRFQRRMDTALGRSQTMSKAVQRFVPRNQLKLMGARSILDVSCGDMVEVASSLLFSDIRDFTTISEGMSQSELFAWLQDYFGQMTRVVEQNRGYVDKFIGDALFCVFTSPTCATQCGVDMQSTVDQLNSRIAADGKLTLVHIGVGIHHGIVAAGVFGDDQRLSCTLVSSDVNLASRLEGVTKVYGARIIISEAVYERIDQERFAMRPLGELQVAGSKMCVSIFEVFQNDVPATKAAKLATRERLQAALELKKTDPAAAVSELAALVSLASELGFEDVALQTKVSQLSRDPTSPDRFGKRGSHFSK